MGADFLPVLFQDLTPQHYLWVAPAGDDAGHGTEGSPLRSVQAAIERASPGTAIMIRAGTYGENLSLSGKHGTPEKPIQLISADGQHAARIVGGPGAATITGYNVSNIVFRDLHVVSNTASGDIGGFKLWGTWRTPAENLLIQGNLITGAGMDGIKLFNAARDNLVVGNTIDGAWRQEAIDNVSVERTVFAYNTILGSAGYTGITMKGGSRDIQLVGNDIRIKARTGIFVGGRGNSRLKGTYYFDWEGWGQTEAERITVEGNFIDAIERSLAFVGSRHSVVKGNYLADPVTSASHRLSERYLYHSHDNEVRDNTVATLGFFHPDPGESKGFVVEGNSVGPARLAVGAAAVPEVRKRRGP